MTKQEIIDTVDKAVTGQGYKNRKNLFLEDKDYVKFLKIAKEEGIITQMRPKSITIVANGKLLRVIKGKNQ